MSASVRRSSTSPASQSAREAQGGESRRKAGQRGAEERLAGRVCQARLSKVPAVSSAANTSDTTYGIFDTFETEDARNAHLGGEIPKALGQVGRELLAKDPDIRMADIVAVK